MEKQERREGRQLHAARKALIVQGFNFFEKSGGDPKKLLTLNDFIGIAIKYNDRTKVFIPYQIETLVRGIYRRDAIVVANACVTYSRSPNLRGTKLNHDQIDIDVSIGVSHVKANNIEEQREQDKLIFIDEYPEQNGGNYPFTLPKVYYLPEIEGRAKNKDVVITEDPANGKDSPNFICVRNTFTLKCRHDSLTAHINTRKLSNMINGISHEDIELKTSLGPSIFFPVSGLISDAASASPIVYILNPQQPEKKGFFGNLDLSK